MLHEIHAEVSVSELVLGFFKPKHEVKQKDFFFLTLQWLTLLHNDPGAPLDPVISSNSSDCSSLKLTLQPAAMANLSISLLTQGQRKLIVFILMKDKKIKKNSNSLCIIETLHCLQKALNIIPAKT